MPATAKETALAMLAEFEAGASRNDIGATRGIGESAVYFQLKFAKFLKYREQHPAADRADVETMTDFYKYWGRCTDKKAPEQTRFAEILSNLPLASDVRTKADLRSAKIAAVESAKPRKAPLARKAKTPAPTEAAAIIETSPMSRALAEPEPTPEPEELCIPASTVADRRAKKSAAQKIRRALARAKIQWKGDQSNTEAAGAAAAE